MSSKPVSPAHLARLEKRKTASEEGALALAEVEAQASAVRKNMERLRALRLAREAEEASRTPAPAAKKSSARAGSKTGSKARAGGAAKKDSKAAGGQPLSEWMASQRETGRLR
jgi:hypothetical protein